MSDEQTGPQPRERTQRTWIGEALAAFDQSLGALPQDGTWPDAGYWLQRAQVAASIAQAQQARVANLIAWKQLRQSQPATALSGAGDAITAEIEAVLGITDPATTGEGRDWIGSPDGTLVYWQQEADEARASLDAIQRAVQEARRRAPHSFEYLTGEVQAILDGTVHGQASG